MKTLHLSLIVILVSVSYTATLAYAQTVPSPPVRLTATPVPSSGIMLSWFPPWNDGGSPITGYRVEYKTPGFSFVTLTSSTATTYTQTGLSIGTTYTYRVFAINSVGESSPSSTVSANPSQVLTVPDPPVKLTTRIISPSSILLSWSPPKNSGGSKITDYRIEYKTPGSSYFTLPSNGTVTKYTQTGLSVGTTYIYRVSAVNKIGVSNTSAETVVTLKNLVTKNIAPDPPTGLIATESSPTSIKLSWSVPKNNGSPITGYKIEYRTGAGQYSVLIANTGNIVTSYLHKGLVAGTEYTYRVSAISLAGTSNPSNESSITTTTTKTTPTNTTKTATTPIPTTKTIAKNLLILSPLKQFKSRISVDKITCNKGFQLMIRNENGHPACVTQETASKLIDRGWGVVPLHGLPTSH